MRPIFTSHCTLLGNTVLRPGGLGATCRGAVAVSVIRECYCQPLTVPQSSHHTVIACQAPPLIIGSKPFTMPPCRRLTTPCWRAQAIHHAGSASTPPDNWPPPNRDGRFGECHHKHNGAGTPQVRRLTTMSGTTPWLSENRQL
jgi:hypothetical protein